MFSFSSTFRLLFFNAEKKNALQRFNFFSKVDCFHFLFCSISRSSCRKTKIKHSFYRLTVNVYFLVFLWYKIDWSFMHFTLYSSISYLILINALSWFHVMFFSCLLLGLLNKSCSLMLICLHKTRPDKTIVVFFLDLIICVCLPFPQIYGLVNSKENRQQIRECKKIIY